MSTQLEFVFKHIRFVHCPMSPLFPQVTRNSHPTFGQSWINVADVDAGLPKRWLIDTIITAL